MSIEIKCSINDLLVDIENPELSKFKCENCNDFIYNKETLQCKKGHFNCKECWVDILSKGNKCNKCNERLNSIDDLSRNLFLENEFGNLIVCCPNSFKGEFLIDENKDQNLRIKDLDNGCQLNFKVTELQDHLENCRFRYSRCRNSVNGCPVIEREYLLEENHYETKDGNSDNICLYSLQHCEHCNRDDIILKDLEKHFLSCPLMIVPCPKCGNKFEKGKWKDHIKQCPNEVISCDFASSGCTSRFIRSNLEDHLTNINHTVYMTKKLKKLENNYEEQHTNSLQIANIANNQLLNKYNSQLKSIYSYFQENLNKPLYYSRPWVISNYTINNQNNNNNNFINSPEIIIGNSKFILIVYPYGDTTSLKNWLSIYIKGLVNVKDNNIEVDDNNQNTDDNQLQLLKQPTLSPPQHFKVKYGITLINHKDCSKNITMKGNEILNLNSNKWFVGSFIKSNDITKQNGWIDNLNRLKLHITIKATPFDHSISPLQTTIKNTNDVIIPIDSDEEEHTTTTTTTTTTSGSTSNGSYNTNFRNRKINNFGNSNKFVDYVDQYNPFS